MSVRTALRSWLATDRTPPARRARRFAVEQLEARDVPSAFNFADFGTVGGLNLQGRAASVNSRLRLTPAQGGLNGSAWYNVEKPLVAGNFQTTFQFQLSGGSDGQNGTDGSDGFTFAIQNTNPTALSGGGGTLGYDGLLNSLVVEFDTFQNSEFGDTSPSSISVHTNGTGPNNANESFSLGHYDTPGFILDNALVHTARVSYTPGSLSVYLDNLATPVLTVPVDLAATLNLDVGRAWVGFTAATGGGFQNHDILNWSFQGDDNLILADHPAVLEGAANTTTPVTFTLTRVGSLAGQAVVNWGTADGTATAGSDYVAASGQVVFQDGESQKTVAVTVLGDDTPEPDETFKLLLSTTAGYTTGSGLATILNDDATVSVTDATATDGDARIGQSIGAFVPQSNNGGLDRSSGMAWGPDGNLYVGSFNANQILRFNGTTGAFLGAFISGVDSPAVQGLRFRPDGKLYVLSRNAAEVQRFDAATGAFLDVFITPGSGGLSAAKGLTVGPDGNWYISSGTNEVLRYGPTGTFLGAFVSAGSGGLNNPRGLTFGPDGNLYVSSANSNAVLRYNGQTGAFLNAFVPTGTDGLTAPGEILFNNGSLYVSSPGTNEVLRFDAQTGAFLDKAASAGLGGLYQPLGLLLDSNNNLLVGSNKEILRYGPQSLAAFNVTLSFPSANPVSVSYATASGSATAGSDFTGVSGTLTFAPGQTTRLVVVPTLDDTVAEPTETFSLNLSAAVGATITRSQGIGTILDDDAAKFFTVDDGSTDRSYDYGMIGAATGNAILGTDGSPKSGSTSPRGAASNAAGTTRWVSDANGKVYVYTPAGGLLGYWASGVSQPEGVATNGTDIWLADAATDRVYRFANGAARRDRSQSATSSFPLAAGNTNPKGITTDGTSFWVVDDGPSTDKVFKYTLAGTLLGSWAIDPANAHPTGLTVDPSGPSDVWVVDNVSLKVYRYAAAAGLTSGSLFATSTFALAAGDTNPQDIADPPPADQPPLPALPTAPLVAVTPPPTAGGPAPLVSVAHPGPVAAPAAGPLPVATPSQPAAGPHRGTAPVRVGGDWVWADDLDLSPIVVDPVRTTPRRHR